MTRFATGHFGRVMFQPSLFFLVLFFRSSRLALSNSQRHGPQYISTSSHFSKEKVKHPNPKGIWFVCLAIAFFLFPDFQVMHSFRFTQKPIISLSLLLLIHSVCSIPTPFQPPHNKEITLALTTRGDDPSWDWTSQDQVWSTPLLQNSNIPAAKGIFLGVKNPAPSAEYVDFVPVTPDLPTSEQEQEQQPPQQQQQPGKLRKGENGCPTIFPSAVCDPGEGVTQITKAALPGFLNLDKCRQSMLSHLFIPLRKGKKKAKTRYKSIRK